MTRVVINTCHGGFDLSDKALRLLFKKKNWILVEDMSKGYSYTVHYRQTDEGNEYFHPDFLPRIDPDLIAVIEELGEEADGDHAKIKIVEIPDDIEWYIEEYDGLEWVAEKHRTWYE